METVEELKGYVRYLYGLLQEKNEELSQMKSDVSEMKEELKAANRRADEEKAERMRLFGRLESFMDEQKSAADEVRALKRKLETAENRLAMANQALYGGSKTCNGRYSGQKSEGANDGRDDFDGTEGSLPEGTPGPLSKCSGSVANDSEEGDSAESPDAGVQEDTCQQSCKHPIAFWGV